MRWKRLGLVFSAADLPLWAVTSALQPTPWRTGAGRLRVFAGFRDSDGRKQLADEVLSLPMYPELDDAQVVSVCTALEAWCRTA